MDSEFHYEIAEEFHCVNRAEAFYDVSIARMDGAIIKLELDDFVKCYSADQAAQVARSLFEALGAMKKARLSLAIGIDDTSRKSSYEDAFENFAQDERIINKRLEKKPNVMTVFEHPNYLYITCGEFSDPQPRVELLNGDVAIYEMIVASEDGLSLEMKFGNFSMRFSREQVLWIWFHMSIAANCLGQYRWVRRN